MIIKPGGYSEAGISTSDIEGWVEFFTQVAGYEEIWRGESPDGVKQLWQIPAEESVKECLLGCPGQSSGLVRLFQFENIDQQDIRAGAHAWDSGGIFDVDIRVPALSPFISVLEKRGWKGISQPVDWQFGQMRVLEWLVRGPDSVIFGLIERLAPPLEGLDDLKKFSHLFNSSQIVSSMERAVDFYTRLGFIEVIRHSGPMPGNGGEVLGLSPDAAPKTDVELVVLQPDGIMQGSVELAKIEGVAGRDLSANAMPYNRGLNLLRFPVNDLRTYAAEIEAKGILPVQKRIISSRLEPFGETEMMALQSPDGAWLEFYQSIES